MRKALCIAAAIFACGICASAQSTITWAFPSRKALMMESERHRSEIDSLKRCIDSLLDKMTLHESDTVALAEVEESPLDARTYSPEEVDSLVNIWYERQKHDFRNCTAPVPENLDSVSFSSQVSDEVMIERLRRINPYFTLPFNQTVKNYMVLYTEKAASRSMPRMLGLSEYYFPIFEEILCRYHLPLELKYMAVIESQFNPVAESRAGAMGMWQFMYRTAKSYGLRISSFVDERLDVEKAADAAARYLRDSYELFGDWNLAICSYNCGTGNVLKAIRRSGSREFWDIYPFLPRETRGYVPAFVGAMYAMEYYREYNIVPEDAGLPALTDTFEIKRNLHLKQVEEMVGVPMETLKVLNPQYVHDIIPGNDGTYVLRIPQEKSGAFISAEADSLYTHKADKLLSEQVLKNIKANGGGDRVAYRVRSGDCLSTIAKRNHCTVSQLRKWNKLRSDNLRIGQILYIYR